MALCLHSPIQLHGNCATESQWQWTWAQSQLNLTVWFNLLSFRAIPLWWVTVLRTVPVEETWSDLVEVHLKFLGKCSLHLQINEEAKQAAFCGGRMLQWTHFPAPSKMYLCFHLAYLLVRVIILCGWIGYEISMINLGDYLSYFPKYKSPASLILLS